MTSISHRIYRSRSLMSPDSAVKLTIFCHGSYEADGFKLWLGTGLSERNINDFRLLASCSFQKIVIRACGVIAAPDESRRGPQRLGYGTIIQTRLAGMHRFYSSLARVCNSSIIAGEELQLTSMDTNLRMRSCGWSGIRWVYNPRGERRAILN